MPNVNVTYSDMKDAAAKLRVGEDDLKSKINDLATYINSLVTDGFVTDHASGAFNDTYTSFTTNATSCVSALEDLAKFLDSAADALEQTDAQLAQSLGN
jgi:WXG100 family type VII secretion target